MKNIYVIVAVTLAVLMAAAVGITMRNYAEYNEQSRIVTEETETTKNKKSGSETSLTTEKETETESTEPSKTETTSATTVYTTETESSQIVSNRSNSVFYYDDGETVYISAEEYYTICGIVMNEGGASWASYEGKIALAQCIRNQIIREKHLAHKYDIESVRATYGEYYTKKPSDEVRRAVTDVFYNHQVVTTEPIIAWCNGGSPWHDQQIAVCSYDGNTFYKLRVKDW